MPTKHSLILLAGAPGTGKGYTANIIRQALPNLTYAPLDMYKEHIYDEIGFDNVEQKDALDEEARQRYYRAIDIMMANGKNILGDYPFSYKQKPYLTKAAAAHDYNVITVRLEAPAQVLYDRQRARDKEEPRHLGHLMQHYHFGDKLTDETKLDGMPSFEVYQRRLTDRGYDKFELGKLIRLDVSDYSKINYEQLIAEIKNAL
ncbi:AAA family ATPase [Lacticaseibacillus camelliae]|nr:AAA family ATPase [Lacticaseibacillus camelliae]